MKRKKELSWTERIVRYSTILILVYYSALSGQNLVKFESVIPSPQYYKTETGEFSITRGTSLIHSVESATAVDFLNDHLVASAGFKLYENPVNDGTLIEFVTEKSVRPGNREAYSLTISKTKIRIEASDPEGFFYAVTTLLQLLPAEIISKKRFAENSFFIRCGSIKDAPKYEWRSFMLDSGRQFQTVNFVKRYLDYLAMMKINISHWHLTEGQGWRIEIKKYPRLTEVGSKVAGGDEQLGYYTQADISEVVEYAKKLFITVVPEIDVPGHSEAALIAYPELTCTGKKPESVMEFSANLFCGGNENTYIFL
ncbi:MAG: family 20 glycosylhydrolase, partial [Melioribacteraceae bacterium]